MSGRANPFRLMDRRDVLKAASATVATSALWPKNSLLAAQAPVLARRTRPGDAGWPSATDWQKLKAAVGGNLIEPRPLFAGCTPDPKSAPCQDVLGNMRNPFYIGDQPSGTQVSGWLDAWTPAASPYAVKPRNILDVVKAVDFARAHNLRLVVKGGGHSYQGTSSAPESLLIWTRAMNALTVYREFVPWGCRGRMAPVPAITAESGAMWIDVYNAVGKVGRYAQGGGCTTVGVAGLIQSGGFGSFSKAFGTAASSLLQAEIVTADGVARLVNACTDPDLFWALKGGGGGSWGVVTSITIKMHDLPQNFGAAWGKVRARSDDAFRKLLAQFVRSYAEKLFNPHWGEQVSIGSDNTLKISMVCQGLTSVEAKAVWQPFFNWVAASPKEFEVSDKFGAGATEARHWWDVAGNDSMIPDRRQDAPADHGWWKGDQEQVGAFLHGYDSLWLSGSLLQPTHQAGLVGALFAASRYKGFGLHFNKGLAGAPPEAIAAAKDTATNPAVTDAFALVIVADGEMPAYPGFPRPPIDVAAARKDARLIDLATAELRKVAPNAGSYVSESNYFNAQWQQAFWGENYAKLRAVKEKYDPGGLFFVHHGVGSEDWSADGFARLAAR
jgi:FAD/FMN-containing dehydrogenase